MSSIHLGGPSVWFDKGLKNGSIFGNGLDSHEFVPEVSEFGAIVEPSEYVRKEGSANVRIAHFVYLFYSISCCILINKT